MRDAGAHYGYLIALFDVLGFEHKLKKRGLSSMADAYEALIANINGRNEHFAKLFGEIGFTESPYWLSDGDVFIFNIIRGAYASDSILLWAPRTWPEARSKSREELKELSKSGAKGWVTHPIPCDNFLDTCNDLICHSVEIGLPLRGAISLGEAVIDEGNRIFLGQPIVDAARMERGQVFIGASFCTPFMAQIVPMRYRLPFNAHLKEQQSPVWEGSVLDWPRHWRNTRPQGARARDAVAALNSDPKYSAYYDITLRSIDASERISTLHESRDDISIRTQYPEFSSADLEVSVRAVRTIPISRE